MSQEQVMVIERSLLNDLGAFQGLQTDVQRYVDAIFAPGVLRFMPRDEAEHDPAFKQLIPYILLVHEGQVFSYVRGKKGGDVRLHDLRTIGIGGHINPEDIQSSVSDTYAMALAREIDEEVVLPDSNDKCSQHPIALINDDLNDVGLVHLGMVHRMVVSSTKVLPNEASVIVDTRFMTPTELHAGYENLESWSQICVSGLNQLLHG